MTYKFKLILITLLWLFVVNPVQSEGHGDHGEDDHHEKEEHGEDHEGESLEAHNHGTAELFIVLVEQDLQIELHSPAANLVGFEHEAKNAEQRAQVESVKQTLENANDLFEISSGACELNDLELDMGKLVADETAHHDEDDEHGDESHDGEEHEEEHADEEHHDEDDHSDTTHSDIEAEYRYSCNKPNSITSVVIKIADQFPGVESLQVQWIVNGRQAATTLENDQREVVFK